MTNAERKVIRELEAITRGVGQVQRETRGLRDDPPGQGKKLDEIEALVAETEASPPAPGTSLLERVADLLIELEALRP